MSAVDCHDCDMEFELILWLGSAVTVLSLLVLYVPDVHSGELGLCRL